MAITFTVTLLSKDWRDDFNGWYCSALDIPSAEVTEIRVGGVKQDDMFYKVDTDHQIIKWTGDPRPESVLISIKIKKELIPAEDIDKAKTDSKKVSDEEWKYYTARLGAIVAIITALITATVSIFGTIYVVSSKQPDANTNTNQCYNNNNNINTNTNVNRSPTPSEPKINLIFKRDMTLNEVSQIVAEDQNARIVFQSNCDKTLVPSNIVTLKNATLSGEEIKEFFEKVIKPRASNKNFCVLPIAKDNSYEISCKQCE